MKKVKKVLILLFLAIVTTFFNGQNVNAEKIKIGDYIYGPYYIVNKAGGKGRYLTSAWIQKANGKFVYCIQPFVLVDKNANYSVATEDIAEIANLSLAQWLRISRIAYYGYGYDGHNDAKWYVAAQVMIWRTVGADSYFTKTLNGTRDDSILAREIAEIDDLVANHTVTPRFTDLPSEMFINDSVTIEDINGVLGKYDVENVSGGQVEKKSGNKIKITATEIGNLTFDLVSKSDRYDSLAKLYYAVDSQHVVETGNIDPISVTLNTRVVGGRIKLTKVDSENNTTTPQGMASLVGAKYNVYNSNNQLVTTLTIGSDSTATSDYLPLGDYTIKEATSSIGYSIDTMVYNARITTSNIVNVTVKEKVVKGKIKLYKYDNGTKKCISQGKASLVGAVYEVYNSKGALVDTITTGSDCSAITKELPYDNYVIKEKTASKGYNLDTNNYSFEIRRNEIIEKVVYEKVITGQFQVFKQDKDNVSFVARGQATLVGAKYGIYNSKNELVDTLTIDSNFQAKSIALPYDDYKIKELEPSKGYLLDPEVYSYSIKTNNSLQKIYSKEKVIENWISILKQYDFVDENTTFLNAESGITFEIYYPNNTLYDTITTDKNGYATITIPYGVWKFHQVNTNTGFEKIYDFYITVDENSEKEQYYNILNNKISSYLQVYKVDAETNNIIAIANTKFKIFNMDTNQYVSQYVGGKVYDNFLTDDEGKFVTYLKLEAGNYKLVEVDPPKGYLLNESGLEFTIGDDTHYAYTTYGPIVTVRFSDTPIKGQIEVYKKGEELVINESGLTYEKIPLSEVKFEIYADEDIKTADGNYMYYEKDKLVDTIYTDENGYAKSKKLPLGKYKVVEIKTKDGYILDSSEHKVTLTEVNNQTPIVYESLNIDNYLKKGNLEFTKTDLVNGEVIPNTLIEITDSNKNILFSGKTDENGKVTINNLPVGRYFIKELQSVDGYLLSSEIVEFEIKENGEIIKAEMKNKPIMGELDFTKVDISTDEPLPNTLIEIYNADNDELLFSETTDEKGKIKIKNLRYGKYYILEKEAPEGYQLNTDKMYFEIKEDGEIIKSTMKDEIIKGNLEFTKVDFSTEEPLPNTEIEIYDATTNELVFTGKTDENGKITIEKLKYGLYYIVEKNAPEGYQLNDERMYFEIKTNGEIVKTTMKDEKIIEVPNTLVNEYYIPEKIGSILIISGIGLFIYVRKNKKK